jgi:hypothetical protein
VGTKADIRPGFRQCQDALCIDDLAVYIAYGKEAIGGKPELSFKIETE